MILKTKNNEFKLNMGEEITVKELRKVFPFISKVEEIWPMEMVVNVIKELSDDKEGAENKINSLDMEEFNELAEQIAKIFDTKKKI